eukprot:jgi/Mesvir1/2499/Mv25503-RA.2
MVKYLAGFKEMKLDEKNDIGYTALHTACQQGHLQVVKCLADQKGMQLESKHLRGRDSGYRNELHCAARGGHLEWSSTLWTTRTSART